MTDLLLQVGANNLGISMLLAVAAWAVQRSGKRPAIAHLLWLLVLVKLITPPLVSVPLVAVPGLSAPADVTATAPYEADAMTSAAMLTTDGEPAVRSEAFEARFGSMLTTPSPASLEGAKLALVALWLLGSAGVLAWSAVRIYRFNRLLAVACRVAPPELQRVAAEVGQKLRLRKIPTIYETSAQVSPMVWWIGRGVRVILPSALPREMKADELRWIVAHELAHIKRRDHLVRWLEWLACVCFWWNPIAWWARRNLRVNEEICCDAVVLASMKPNPKTYANSLLTVVEFLTAPAIRPPAMASEINSGGFLERRFKMIISDKALPRPSRTLYVAILLCAAALLPLGLAHAQKPDFEAVGNRLKKAVEAGELTEHQAEVMMGALARARFSEQVHADGNNDDRNSGRELQGHFKRVGIDGERFKRIMMGLHESGIAREKLQDVAGGLLRVAYEMKSEGKRFELDPRLRTHFENMGITKKQLETVHGIAKRIAFSMKDSTDKSAGRGGEEWDALMRKYEEMGVGVEMFKRMTEALHEKKVPREKIQDVMRVMIRVVYEMKTEGDRFELDPGMHRWFKETGLDEGQVELVQGLAKRILYVMKNADASEEDRKGSDEDKSADAHDWEAIKMRIEGAVKAGRLTREEADAKYRELREKMRPSDR